MFEQIKLNYEFNALEPHIDALTMETHYGKHHKTYTNNFNDAVEKANLTDKSVEEILGNLDAVEDLSLRKALRNNGGGFYNHNLYFSMLSPNPKEISSTLLNAINKEFGSFDELKNQLTKLALGQFGSGWAWLSSDKEGKLSVCNTLNQDNPISLKTNQTPILAIDVWEHAYYLKYKNLRADYVDALFNVIDWSLVSQKYEEIIK